MRFYLYSVFFLVGVLGCHGKEKASLPQSSKNQKQTVVVQKSEPLPMKTENETRLVGQVSYLNKALLLFKTPGNIQRILAKPGQFLKKGQVLAELDSRDHELRLEGARLKLSQALNQKRLAEREYNSEKKLREHNINSPVQLENSQINNDNASLMVKMAEVELKMAQKAVDDTRLRAPYDCVVSRQIKYEGESSMGGMGPDGAAAFEIYEAGSPEILLNAPETMMGKIHVGDAIQITVPALGLSLPGKIIRYVPVISELSRNFTVVVHLDQDDKRVVPGYFVEGVIKAL